MLQTKVVYQDAQKVEKLLGKKGLPLLQHVLSMIQERAARENWPLEQIIVSFWQDMEVKNWESVFVDLDFGSMDNDRAEAYLASLSPLLNGYASTLGPELKEIFLTLIHYDLRRI